ncbi:MAG: helix-turn-helix transcriptional regulator [Lachnospiraceae bacterium]|nr:helix-turn-helix transcriptional regulator [Lachnospiraceae bacterium]
MNGIMNNGEAMLDTVILSIVAADPEGTYGYKITKDVRVRLPQVSESEFYPVLQRLQENGLLEVYHKDLGGRSRRFYKITDSGRQRLASYQETIRNYVEANKQQMQPGMGMDMGNQQYGYDQSGMFNNESGEVWSDDGISDPQMMQGMSMMDDSMSGLGDGLGQIGFDEGFDEQSFGGANGTGLDGFSLNVNEEEPIRYEEEPEEPGQGLFNVPGSPENENNGYGLKFDMSEYNKITTMEEQLFMGQEDLEPNVNDMGGGHDARVDEEDMADFMAEMAMGAVEEAEEVEDEIDLTDLGELDALLGALSAQTDLIKKDEDETSEVEEELAAIEKDEDYDESKGFADEMAIAERKKAEEEEKKKLEAEKAKAEKEKPAEKVEKASKPETVETVETVEAVETVEKVKEKKEVSEPVAPIVENKKEEVKETKSSTPVKVDKPAPAPQPVRPEEPAQTMSSGTAGIANINARRDLRSGEDGGDVDTLAELLKETSSSGKKRGGFFGFGGRKKKSSKQEDDSKAETTPASEPTPPPAPSYTRSMSAPVPIQRMAPPPVPSTPPTSAKPKPATNTTTTTNTTNTTPTADQKPVQKASNPAIKGNTQKVAYSEIRQSSSGGNVDALADLLKDDMPTKKRGLFGGSRGLRKSSAEPFKEETKKPESIKEEVKTPEPPKAEVKKSEPPKAEVKKSEPPKAEVKKPEPPKPEVKKEEPKVDDFTINTESISNAPSNDDGFGIGSSTPTPIGGADEFVIDTANFEVSIDEDPFGMGSSGLSSDMLGSSEMFSVDETPVVETPVVETKPEPPVESKPAESKPVDNKPKSSNTFSGGARHASRVASKELESKKKDEAVDTLASLLKGEDDSSSNRVHLSGSSKKKSSSSAKVPVKPVDDKAAAEAKAAEEKAAAEKAEKARQLEATKSAQAAKKAEEYRKKREEEKKKAEEDSFAAFRARLQSEGLVKNDDN